ncbi:hypothetical protein BGZ60DRAFT_381263 [Tricladium varicosporioides]|nr:hypothetical protein BGZ60DRAFT_381263 [Hymenoscyphus varicosporioides]
MKNSRVRGFRGSRSLQDTAIECILNNISDVTFEGMQCLPDQMVRRIWHAVNKRCLLSFNTWMIFSKLLCRGEGASLGLLRYRQNFQKPTSPLIVYTVPITSQSFEFITSLSITTTFSVPDLVKLSHITNLGVLEVISNDGVRGGNEKVSLPVSDRLVRAWAIAASDEGAFKVLRILKLWYHEDLTSKSLAYLNDFPALALYDVRGCTFDLEAKTHAKSLGWKATTEANVLDLLEAACVERAVLMQTSLGVETKPVRKQSARQLWEGSKIRRIARSEVPLFLTRPETAIPGEPLMEHESFSRIQASLDKLESHHADKSIKDNRWKIMDRHVFSKSRAAETWEFNTYTCFARIGELRNDSDLARAGVDVGDQVLVGNELVNSVPMVSIRLGETPSVLQPSSASSAHKPFYSSMYEDSAVSSLKYDRERASSSTRTLSFIRIKVPPTQQRSEPSSSQPSSDKPEEYTKKSAPSGKLQKKGPPMRQGSIMKNKRRKIEEVWNSLR